MAHYTAQTGPGPAAQEPVIVSGFDYLNLPSSPETWLIDGLLPTSGCGLLYGDPKVGKSFAALQLACCLATGTEWLGFSIPHPVPSVYVQLDTPRSLWKDRVSTLAKHGWPVELIYQTDRELLKTFPFNILDPSHFARLVTALHSLSVTSDEGEDVHIDPGVVIIDTLRESHAGDENDSTEMQEVIAHLEAAVKPAALILISHSRKVDPERGLSIMNDNRGSNYVVGRMDAIIRFSPKSMRVSSRFLEEHSTDLERADDGTWTTGADPLKTEAKNLLKSNDSSVRELARILHEKFPSKSENACRAVLRRAGGPARG